MDLIQVGTFDTILFKCPNCGANIPHQTKGGVCRLEEYDYRAIPMPAASDVIGDRVMCNDCMTSFQIVIPYNQYNVTLKLQKI